MKKNLLLSRQRRRRRRLLDKSFPMKQVRGRSFLMCQLEVCVSWSPLVGMCDYHLPMYYRLIPKMKQYIKERDGNLCHMDNNVFPFCGVSNCEDLFSIYINISVPFQCRLVSIDCFPIFLCGTRVIKSSGTLTSKHFNYLLNSFNFFGDFLDSTRRLPIDWLITHWVKPELWNWFLANCTTRLFTLVSFVVASQLIFGGGGGGGGGLDDWRAFDWANIR